MTVPPTPDPPFPPSAERLRERYEPLSVLGRGGMAVVWLARERASGALVAIKLIAPRHGSTDDDALRRFAREAGVVARLRHPNLVRTLAVERLDAGGLAIVHAYVHGRTLRAALRAEGPQGAFAPERAARVLRDVAAGLAHAHAARVVHRDVKPENVFLEDVSDRALLADFGIARPLEADAALTMDGASLGTPQYMAPEQIVGAAVDERADVYALGLVGWEMLTGRRPWEGETLYGVLHRQQHERLPDLAALRPDIPVFLLAAIEGAIAKEPAGRWRDASAFLAALTPRAAALPDLPALPATGAHDAAGGEPVGDDATTVRRMLPPPAPVPVPVPEPASMPASGTASAAEVGAEAGAGRPFDVRVRRVAPHPPPPRGRTMRWRPALAGLALLLAIAVGALLFGDRGATRGSDRAAGGRTAAGEVTLDGGATGSAGSGTAPAERSALDSLLAAAQAATDTVARGTPPTAARTEREAVVTAPTPPRPGTARTPATGPTTVPAGEAGAPRRSTTSRLPGGAGVSGGTPVPAGPAADGGVASASLAARCRSAANDDQRACLLGRLSEVDADLTAAYAALIAVLRREAGGAREPATVRALRAEQRAWLVRRDAACRDRAREGALWGAARVPCFADQAARRAAELRARTSSR